MDMQGDSSITAGETLYRLPVDWEAGAETRLHIEQAGRYVLFTQHLPEEFEMKLTREGADVAPAEGYEYASPHEHDDTVGSVGVRLTGDLDPDRFEQWMVALLRPRHRYLPHQGRVEPCWRYQAFRVPGSTHALRWAGRTRVAGG